MMEDGEEEASSLRSSLSEALSPAAQRRYFRAMRLWFAGRLDKDGLDEEAREILGSKLQHLHNQFVLALLKKCDLSLACPSQTAKAPRRALKRPVAAVEKGLQSRCLTSKAEPRHFFAPPPPSGGAQQEQQQTASPTPELVSDAGGLLSSGQLQSRLLTSIWEEGIPAIQPEAEALLQLALEAMLKNFIQRVAQLRRSFALSHAQVPHGFQRSSTNILVPMPELPEGTKLEGESHSLLRSAAPVPISSPASSACLEDLRLALKLWPELIPDASLRAAFTNRLLLQDFQ